jgi:Domain of unknown function (DUF4287)
MAQSAANSQRALRIQIITIYCTMSFQAYLDNIETKTGKTPDEFIILAKIKGYDKPETKATNIINWLKTDFELGRGHAMALVHLIKHGPKIGEKHVGSKGVHNDESNTLRTSGKK